MFLAGVLLVGSSRPLAAPAAKGVWLYPGAIALLEDLLPKVEDPDLRQTIETLLERFRRDAVRLRQTVE